jgi:hypothetical protein
VIDVWHERKRIDSKLKQNHLAEKNDFEFLVWYVHRFLGNWYLADLPRNSGWPWLLNLLYF